MGMLESSSATQGRQIASGSPWMSMSSSVAASGDGLLGLADLLAGPAQGPAGPVSSVLVVDDLVTVLGGRPGGPGLGEDVRVGDVLAGVLAVPLGDHIGDARDLHAEDERQPGGLDLLLALHLLRRLPLR
jgi:hypothetical protein